MQKPELLAPAGSFAALRAAVKSGADAVYLGGVKFSAREGAENFSLETLAQAVLFAHRSKVKVYVAVNTLLKDDEMEDALDFLRCAHNIGADAAIVQDLGLAGLLRQYLPALELHASTQMTTTSLSGVRALAARGFHRVVLARELTKGQIKEIVEAKVLPCEVFIHGALCVAYSGQCLFSSLLGARSGNRGQCAQPCRLPYSENDASYSYPLSPKDLCRLEHLSEVMALNCASLKIEGRLKRPEYVAEVVSIYRRAIDNICEKGSHASTPLEQRQLAQSFNRGFTTGFFYGKPGRALYSGDSPGHRGVQVGTVVENKEGQAVVSFSVAAHSGDVLAFGQDETVTLTINYRENALGVVATTKRHKMGQVVNRLVDARRNQELMDEVLKFSSPTPPASWQVSGREGGLLTVSLSCLGHAVTVWGDEPLERSKGQIAPLPLLERQLSKLGGTPFVMGEVRAEVDPFVFLSISEINSCRRRAVELLSQELWGNPCPVEPVAPVYLLPEKTKARSLPLLVVSVADASEAFVAARAGARELILGKEWAEEGPSEQLEGYKALKEIVPIPVALRLPRIMHTEEEAAWQSNIHKDIVYYASSLGGVELILQQGGRVRGDVGLNVLNSYAAEALPGLLSVTASLELSQAELRRMNRQTNREVEVVVHSRQLLMVLENSGYAAFLRDRKGMRFSLAEDMVGRAYLLNSQVQSHIDVLYALLGMPISRLRLDIAGVGAELVERTVRLYTQALEAREDKERAKILRGNLMADWGLLTRGHWQRGV